MLRFGVLIICWFAAALVVPNQGNGATKPKVQVHPDVPSEFCEPSSEFFTPDFLDLKSKKIRKVLKNYVQKSLAKENKENSEIPGGRGHVIVAQLRNGITVTYSLGGCSHINEFVKFDGIRATANQARNRSSLLKAFKKELDELPVVSDSSLSVGPWSKDIGAMIETPEKSQEMSEKGHWKMEGTCGDTGGNCNYEIEKKSNGSWTFKATYHYSI